MAITKKTQSTILTDMITYVNSLTSKVKDFSVGSAIRAILMAIAFQIDEMYYIASSIWNSAFLSTAIGTDLDNQALPLTPRIGATYAAGYVTFARSTAAGTDYIIPSGSYVITDPDPITGAIRQYYTTATRYIKTGDTSHYANAIKIKYLGTCTAATVTISGNTLITTITGAGSGDSLSLDLTDPLYNTLAKIVGYINNYGGTPGAIYACEILPATATYPASTGIEDSAWLRNVTGTNIRSTAYPSFLRKDPAPVIADTIGPDYDISSSQITTLKNNITGIESVTNEWAISGGILQEDDTMYRARAQAIIGQLSVGVPTLYDSFAIASNPGIIIRSKTIPENRGPGTIDTMIVTTFGIAPGDVIAACKAYMLPKISPLVDFDVKTFTFVTVNITAGTVIITKDAVWATVLIDINKALNSLVSYINYPFGDDLTEAKIYNAILSVSGVYDVTSLTMSPTSPVAISNTQFPVMGTVTLTPVTLP